MASDRLNHGGRYGNHGIEYGKHGTPELAVRAEHNDEVRKPSGAVQVIDYRETAAPKPARAETQTR